MEIERKYLIEKPPESIGEFPCLEIEQAYLCTEPVIRIRRQNGSHILTCKSKGLLVREEFETPLTEDSYRHLMEKADGIVITKKRYQIPLGEALMIELDIFSGRHEGLILAEVEFQTREAAEHFVPPAWFGREVTFDSRYQNSYLSKEKGTGE